MKLKRLEAWTYIDDMGNNGPVLFKYCIRCGRMLKNPDAQKRGYGEICWKKQQHDNQATLF